ncbi:HDIG domain-containing protein [Thermoanaerobacter thermohydrosulfuricus]|uniref:HDIG domain-containing protein n=1 Tax=Thermoanaerobacter thermohydrosulfuricus TaxID=1516 RepID=A0A1G7T3H2_THETY|nr:HD-GYP domain-containing protein [Thermoanaerobacter thermohydrosulfuricus]SDG29805.1 HDIG domain-containing protein [Thermoanaerobacter thermohydrosulfuricus]
MNLNYNNLLSALSLALDVQEYKNMGHARRVAYISLRISEMLNLDEKETKKVYYSALLHDIGQGDIYEDFNKDEWWKHSERGSEIVKKLPFGENFSDIIRYHHENYDGSGHFRLNGDSIPLGAQIVFISDQFDIRYTSSVGKESEYNIRNNIKEGIKSGTGKMFNPVVANALLDLTRQEKFWLDYKFFDIKSILKRIEPKDTVSIGINELEDIAEVFAQIIDNRSRFTYNHSKGISKLAYEMAKVIGYDEETSRKIKIAGLLHDLGKLAIPNSILDKPDKLTEEEFMVIKSHTYYTKEILKEIGRIDDIAEWAANHHEKLDGSGYPEGLKGDEIGEIDRHVAVCDMYQALTEDRPYRKGLEPKQAIDIIAKSVKDNKVSGESLEILKEVVL